MAGEWYAEQERRWRRDAEERCRRYEAEIERLRAIIERARDMDPQLIGGIEARRIDHGARRGGLTNRIAAQMEVEHGDD